MLKMLDKLLLFKKRVMKKDRKGEKEINVEVAW